jgi:hypothetical protein
MDRRRLEGRAAAYDYLRGLRAIPGGLAGIVFALGNWQAGPFASDLVVLGALALCAAAWYAIDRAYQRRYGRMTRTPAAEWRQLLGALVVIAIVLGGSLLLHALDVPVNPIAITFPIAFVAMYAVGGALRPHHLVVWGAVLAAGLLPIWEGPPDAGNVALVLCGVAVIVGGLLDHLAFTRTFAPPALDA